jgi:hypothetical protein
VATNLRVVVLIKRASIIEPLLGANVGGRRRGSTAKARGTPAQPPFHLTATRGRGRARTRHRQGTIAVDLFGVDRVPDGHFG